jgi:hypothetical protein
METSDFKILKQLSPEAKEKVELKLTVKELITYAKYLTAVEKLEIKEPVTQQNVISASEVAAKEKETAAEIKPEHTKITSDLPERKERQTTKKKTPKKQETKENIQAVVAESNLPEDTAEDAENTIFYYRPKDVAKIYNVGIITVYKWIHRGILKVDHRKGKQMFFSKSDVETLNRKKGKRKPESDSQ